MKDFLDKFKDNISNFREMKKSEQQAFFVKVIGLGAVAIIAAFFLFSTGTPQNKTKKAATASSQEKVKTVSVKDDNGLLGEEIDRKAYVERLESQYYAVSEKNEELEGHLKELTGKLGEMSKVQSKLVESLATTDARLLETAKAAADARAVGEKKSEGESPAVDPARYRLEVINLNPLDPKNPKTVYLPAGSFVRGTLLTGVYAPSDQGNPLPVLIRLNEAFYGPNETRIPLEGSFVIGKASGDLTSERALIQITTLSSVLPSGEAFEQRGNIGYITDTYGQLGLKGIVVRNTGKQLAMAFMSGFVGGGSEALADSETTTVEGQYGTLRRNVTGDVSRHAGFSGLAQSAAQLSKYYMDQLEKIVPAVKVDAGVEVYLIVLEGVKVYGLTKDDSNRIRDLD
ncbi:MAG: TraB/VirB10 family protein [Candidatus Omnitrophica bacterium]|nr:TraB/VirB10 family protein [Candidatus Omnitrophota bacterium]